MKRPAMSEWLSALGPAGTAFSLLLLGHTLGEFVFQTDTMATSKHRLRPLLTHGGIVTVVHVVVFLPLLTSSTVLLLLAIGVAHLLIDAVTGRLRGGGDTTVGMFLSDQLAHLAVLVSGWWIIDATSWLNAPVVTTLGGVSSLPWSAMTAGAVYVSALAFAHKGGSAIVRGVLPDEGPEPDGDDLEAGSLIGSLERWIILLLGFAGMWESVALVVAAKSVARFEELKERAFAEYFLVGTLTSVLVAIGLVALVTLLV